MYIKEQHPLMDQENSDNSGNSGNTNKTIVTVAVLLVIVLIVGGAVAFGKHSKAKTASSTAAATTATTPAATDTTTTADTTAQATTSTFKDGTYKTNASYDSPGGTQNIAVSITLKDGVVTDSSVT